VGRGLRWRSSAELYNFFALRGQAPTTPSPRCEADGVVIALQYLAQPEVCRQVRYRSIPAQ
jgi:hypothetical protein